jgi:hypothetical protein
VSKADGGSDTYENLITACSNCNGGKGARSLLKVPDSAEVAERMAERAKSIKAQAKAMAEALAQEKALEQQAINLKCDAYDTDSVQFLKGETGRIVTLCKEHGAENVLRWYGIAAEREVSELRALPYVYGIIRNVRKDQERA